VDRHRFEKAIREYKELYATDASPRTAMKIGDLYWRLGDGAESGRWLLRAGETYLAEGFKLKAVALFKQVVSQGDPELAPVATERLQTIQLDK